LSNLNRHFRFLFPFSQRPKDGFSQSLQVKGRVNSIVLLLEILITHVKEEYGHPLRGKIHIYQQLHADAETSGTSISSTRHAA
jgi:hypothetical protein